MNPPAATQARAKPDDTRARIIETADTLFRRLGYAKTAVADIASELGMSPANVYRFFPSKNAIVEAICQRCLGELEATAWTVARSRGSASGRLERLFLDILAYHKANLLTDQKLNDIVLVAMEQNWQAIKAHKQTMRMAVELIMRDGIESGEFEAVDPAETAGTFVRSMVHFCNPIMVAEGLRENEDLEAETRATVRFLLRAITPR